MKRLTRSRGYTIVEVMIFLVITGALLASGLLVFSGRQQSTQFTQGVREINAQINTLVNETTSGFYPNQGNIRCTSVDGSGPNLDTSIENEQGSNEGCIFLGRILQFTAGSTYTAYTVVGQRQGFNGQQVTSLGAGPNDARQTLITPPENDVNSQIPDASAVFTLPWGITVSRVAVPSLNPLDVGAIGFISSLGSYSEGDPVSGSSGIRTVALINTDLGSAKSAIITATESMTNTAQNPGRIVICLSSGGGDRKAAIIMGGNNNNTGTEVVIDNVPGEC